jgi:hypothetical protein
MYERVGNLVRSARACFRGSIRRQVVIESIGKAAEKVVAGASRRQFLGRLGQSALAVVAAVSGMLVFPATTYADKQRKCCSPRHFCSQPRSGCTLISDCFQPGGSRYCLWDCGGIGETSFCE